MDHFTTKTRLRTCLAEPADLIWFLNSKNHLTGVSSITGNPGNKSVKASNEHGHSGRFLALVVGVYGGASSDLILILYLVLWDLPYKHAASRNTNVLDFTVAPPSAGGSPSLEQNSQGTGK